MVEIRQHAVDLVGIGIPPGEERHLNDDTDKHHQTTRQHAIDSPHQQRGDGNLDAPRNHGMRILHLRIAEEDDEQREQQVAERRPLDSQQSLLRLLLDCQ